MGPNPSDIVRIVEYDPTWPDAFEAEKRHLQNTLPNLCLTHIGSTSVPDLCAKPIIDLLGEIPDLSMIDLNTALFEAVGYQALGEFGLKGRRYFRKVTRDGRRTHHLHIYQTGAPDVHRHVVFRDYLRAHPKVAQIYGHLKRSLVQIPPTSSADYMDGKDKFVKKTEQAALAWYRSGKT